jgi:glycosyltransferase involved in cell wall biosynthesis
VGLWGRALGALRAEQRRGRFDLLHAFWATEAGALAAVAGRLLGVPSIVSLAGGELVGMRDIGYGDQLAPLQRAKVRLALRLADCVTGGSRYLLNLSPRRAHYLPLGVDTTLFQPPPHASRLTSHAPRLVHAASLVPVKDQAMLLRAVARLRERGHGATLTIAGEGPEEGRLRGLASDLGIADAVTFLGAVAHDRLPEIYRAGALFVMTSRHEAQGMAPLEAAACGLPVAGTAVGVLPELMPDAASVVPIGDDAALADAIAAIIADPAQYGEMRAAARAVVVERFGLGQTAEAFQGLYRAVVGRRRPGRHRD